jgi:cytochrome c biogenesis protein CcdA/glutaredoxin
MGVQVGEQTGRRLGHHGRGRPWWLHPVVWLALTVLASSILGAPVSAAATEDASQADGTVELTLFWWEGCPHCEAEREFLAELAATRPELVVRDHEVSDAANQQLFSDMALAAGVEPRAVPTTFLGERVWVGFDDRVAAQIQLAVDEAIMLLPEAESDADTTEAPDPAEGEQAAVVDVPLVGPVDVGAHSLVASTLVIGFVDGVNPCSLWVLSILLALVVHAGSRRRVVVVGTAFLTVTAAMYGLYMAGFYSALRFVDYLGWIQVGVALLVGVLGVLQLKDVVAFHRGPSLGLPDRAKPGMYARMRRLGDVDRSLPGVLGATAALAVGVSLLETPCTLGLPLMWTDLLARNDVAASGAALLFVVYLGAFLVDELLLFGGVVLTMRAVRLQERHGRELKLVSGVTMLGLAVVMVAAPTLLETFVGALAVFAAVAVVAAAGLLALHASTRRRPAAATGPGGARQPRSHR